MVSWKEQMKVSDDKKQTILSPKGCSPNPNKYATYIDKHDFTSVVMCPFCLRKDFLHTFEHKSGLYICSECGNKMMLNTLVKKMDVRDFARWVYEYRKNGFFQKVYPDFKEWSKRLNDMGISYDFWEFYKELRGDVVENDEY